MKHMLSRPARAALPLMLAAAALYGSAADAAALMAAILMARLCSLCAGAALRTAAAAVINAARLRGNLLTSIIFGVIGGALPVALNILGVRYIADINVYILAAGGLVSISQILSDRLYASPDSVSPPMYDIITAVFCIAGLMLSGGDRYFLPILAALPAAAGALLLFGLRRGAAVRPGFHVLRCVPAALFKNALFPVLIAAGALTMGKTALFIGALAGWAMLELAEPPFRRSAEEGAAASTLIALAAAISAVCAAFIHGNIGLAFAAPLTACVGAMVTGCPFGARHGIQWLLAAVSAACAADVHLRFTGISPVIVMQTAAVASAAAALALSAPDLTDIRRKLRARRIQRRRS